jgi:hypothetical protein
MESDPIGVPGTPEAAGEYDCMIGPHYIDCPAKPYPSPPPHHPFRRRRDCAGRRRPGVRRSRAAAFATLPPPEPGRTGDTAPVVTHTVIVGGMPGVKIILIAAAAAVPRRTVHAQRGGT